ncbi:MAG: glycosyltransferase family 39 protein, partial [Oscillospiraceae bacterium]|nr:glycosyltransferase family 39 protein [Oscillospiraceae bacterium]
MISVAFSAVVMLIAGILTYMSVVQPYARSNKIERSSNTIIYFIFMIAAAFVVRIVAAAKYPGHETDMNCFSAWSSMVFNDGFAKFYTSDAFTDYPPGYMYILWIIGALKTVVTNGTAVRVLVKMPALICDIITGCILYDRAKQKFSDNLSLIIAAFYLFNPAVLINSAFWGQVDAVYTLALVVMMMLIADKKLIYSYIVFGIAVFIKPQAFMFAPVLIYAMIEQLFIEQKGNNERNKIILKNMLSLVASVAVVFALMLPFGIKNVIDQYIATLQSYPYMTVNAMNIWAAFGQNWAELTPIASVAGYLFIVVIVAVSGIIFFKSKSPSKYYFTAGFIASMSYMFSVKMHERYAFAAMIMFIMAYIRMPSSSSFYAYFLTSVSQFLNTAYVLFVYQKSPNDYFRHPMVMICSWINIALTFLLIWHSKKAYVSNRHEFISQTKKKAVVNKDENLAGKKRNIEKSRLISKITVADITAMIVITAIYGCVAVYDLGDKVAPQNEYLFENAGDSIVLDMGERVSVDKLQWFTGSYENRKINVNMSDTENFIDGNSKEIDLKSVFSWKDDKLNQTGRYMKISAVSDKAMIEELAIIDKSGEKIVPVNADEFAGLFDEQEYVVEKNDFRNSTYFDEIYHARTAYEFIHGLHVYEWTHPPFGKVILSWGIMLFGMTPFGWRIAGTVVGILMVPFIYLAVKDMFGKTYISIVATILFSFDFMHFAQTRIATIDVYGTFFIILMYYFMYKYYSMSFYDTPLKKTFVPLALSGISMGFAAASKWTGIYAAVGLAVIFFISYIKRYREYIYAKNNINGETNGISHRYIAENYKSLALGTFLFCCAAFIVVPLVIYCLSYIPYLMTEDAEGFKTIINNQSAMLTYHGSTVLGSKHSYSSKWYEWIIMKRPIWYFSSSVDGDVIKEGISAFGNPLVWWAGIPAYLYVCFCAIKKKDKTALFIMIGYLSQLIFWIPIERLTCIYHYFPSV